MRTTIELITPKKAQEYLSKNAGNRKLNDRSVSYCSDLMKRGEWMLTPQGISFDTSGKLIDGQHRLSAIIHSNTSQQFLVIRDANAGVFKVLDTGKNRSAGDVLFIEGIKNSTTVSGVLKKYIGLKKGISSINSRVNTKTSNADILNEYNNNPELVQKVTLMAKNNYASLRIIKVSTLGAFILFLHLDKKYPLHFIENFVTELHTYSANNTINLFRNRLLNNKLRKITEPVSITEALFIKTWNSYVTNKSMKTLRFVPEVESYPEFI